MKKEYLKQIFNFKGVVDLNLTIDIFTEYEHDICWLVFVNEHEDGAISYRYRSLYEFMSILKEWFTMYGRGYCISSFQDFDGTWFANVSGTIHKEGFQGESEPEAIMKACIWIVDYEDELERKSV